MILKDKVALVTGGNGGLGRGIAKAFIAEGAKVALCNRNETDPELIREIHEMGGECLGLQCDITSSEQVKETFAKVVERFGTLDILVNNAARVPDDAQSEERRNRHYALLTKPIPRHSLGITKNISDDEWMSYFKVNVHGAFFCTREALKIMEEKKSGKIINIASFAGISAMSAHSPHYSASKAALVGFTKSVAAEVAGAGISVNCIAPGFIATPALKAYLQSIGEQGRNEMFQMIPSGRIGEVEEYAVLAVYLASDAAGYLVGQIISPNGGFYI